MSEESGFESDNDDPLSEQCDEDRRHNDGRNNDGRNKDSDSDDYMDERNDDEDSDSDICIPLRFEKSIIQPRKRPRTVVTVAKHSESSDFVRHFETYLKARYIQSGTSVKHLLWYSRFLAYSKIPEKSNDPGWYVVQFVTENMGGADMENSLTKYGELIITAPNLGNACNRLNGIEAMDVITDYMMRIAMLRDASRIANHISLTKDAIKFQVRRMRDILNQESIRKCCENEADMTLTYRELMRVLDEEVIPDCNQFVAYIRSHGKMSCTRRSYKAYIGALLGIMSTKLPPSRSMEITDARFTELHGPLSLVARGKRDDFIYKTTRHKTRKQYLFKSILITKPVAMMLYDYDRYVRRGPRDDTAFFFTNSKGGRITYASDWIGPHFHRYHGKWYTQTKLRQLLETSASSLLDPAQLGYIRRNDAHSGTTADLYYNLQHSSTIARRGLKAYKAVVRKSKELESSKRKKKKRKHKKRKRRRY